MATFSVFLTILVAWLVTRIYARAIAGMTPTGQTVVDVVHRIAEFEAALFCVLAGTWFLLFADLTDVSVGHSWMLRIGPEPAWIAALYLIGGLILLAALSRPGLIRGAGLMAGITFFSGVAVAAIHAHAMPVSTCALIAHTAALTVSFWRRYE